jgi:hypothetical protein
MRRRFVVQVGTLRALEDVGTLLRLLVLRDVLGDLARRLPIHLRVFDREPVDQAKALIEGAAVQKSPDLAARKADIFLCGLILVMGRLATPWQLIRVATRAAESDETARIAETPFADAVAIVLGEIEAMVGELRVELKARRPVTSLLKAFTTPPAACAPSWIFRSIRPGAANWRRSAPTSPTCSSPRSNRRLDVYVGCCGSGRPMRSRLAHCSMPSM